jgi:hypothetical protein
MFSNACKKLVQNLSDNKMSTLLQGKTVISVAAAGADGECSYYIGESSRTRKYEGVRVYVLAGVVDAAKDQNKLAANPEPAKNLRQKSRTNNCIP